MTNKLKFWLVTLALSVSTPIMANKAGDAIGLSAEQVFQILASEIGLQRGEAGIAYQTYIGMARNSRDGRLAQRAMEIAIAANSPNLALDAARLWDELEPKEAKKIFGTLLMINQRWSESVAPAQVQLKNTKSLSEKEKLINSWRPLIARSQDEDAGLIAFYEITRTTIHLINNEDILYFFSLAAEKSKQFNEMEQTLKRLIKKNPNNHSALNALGYSYADRGIKLNEAVVLLEKAQKLAPKDMLILDSVAWANYKLGKKELAVEQLQQAFALQPEAEIGAHLGEVLWASSNKEAADIAWRKAESIDANNKTLKETLERLWPKRVPSSKMIGNQQLWDGRFGVKVTGQKSTEGGSGGFSLSHDGHTDILDIRNPLGGALAKITITASGAKLEDGDKVFEAHDADALLQNYLGLPLPARGLSYWLNGRARIGSSAKIERDPANRAIKMIQDGWLMSFSWNEKHQLEKMDLERQSSDGPIVIKLLFEPVDN
jgi:outer membrane biogenesis lipoprotein LolB